MSRYFIIFLTITICLSCGDNNHQKRLDSIKLQGDTDPLAALDMLDSIHSEIDQDNKYTKMKCMLLHMRLKDKAYLMPSSNDSAKYIIKYFSDNGTNNDKQEAYYYAGSVYRDLRDTPRALECFMKSAEIAKNSTSCDTILLRNTYSNIETLLFNVQDYSRALQMALKEYELSKKTGKISINSIFHVGNAYLMLDSIKKADYFFCKVSEIRESLSSEDLYLLLFYLSSVNNKVESQAVYGHIMKKKLIPDNIGYFALGKYYSLINKLDSSVFFFEKILRSNEDLMQNYDATKLLYRLYKAKGDKEKSLKYADMFIECSETLDLGKRQELAATVNNQFNYYKDRQEEQRITKENENFRKWLSYTIAASVILGSLLLLFFYYKKNKYLRNILSISNNLNTIKKEKEGLKQKYAVTKTELENTKILLEKNSTKLKNISDEIKNIEQELRYKELMLAKKLEENKIVVNMLHKAELEEKASEVITTIKKASEGRHKMSAEEWQKFYHAVDELQPDLMEKIMHNINKFTEQQQQVCYLMSIGLTNTQIENLTDIPHVTVWRWVKKFDWI